MSWLSKDVHDVWEEIRRGNAYLEHIYYSTQRGEAEKSPPLANFLTGNITNYPIIVVGANPFRHELLVINSGADTVWLSTDTNVLMSTGSFSSNVTTNAFELPSGDTIRLRYSGLLAAACATGNTTTLSIVETVFTKPTHKIDKAEFSKEESNLEAIK